MSAIAHPAAIDVNGALYLRDAKGGLMPLSSVKPVDLLMDETVRAILKKARELSELVAGFKVDAFDQVGGLQSLIAQNYGTALGGRKGNITMTRIDGCEKVTVQIADLIEFGPELQAAKTLIDECVLEWAADSRIELKAIVNRVFSADKGGQINRAELFSLLRVEIHDERWQRAMEAIRESIRIVGSRAYMRFYSRPDPDAPWRAVTIDLAAA